MDPRVRGAQLEAIARLNQITGSYGSRYISLVQINFIEREEQLVIFHIFQFFSYFQGKNDEACLAVLNNYYKDGIVWHDIACYHKKPFVCEDSDDLIRFMEQTNPGIVIKRS